MKVLFCILGNVLLALVAFSFPLEKENVSPQCADPTFACQDLENARACGVVKSCIHDIWATMSAPEDNDQICDICKEMVKEARDQLLSNMTQEEIKEVFEGSCKLLPVKLVADACIKLVDEFIPELVEMLASRMDPTMVCTVSGLCNLAHLPIESNVLKFFKMVLNIKKETQCTECTKMLTDVQTFLKSTPEAEVKTYIENFCDKEVPSYLCDILVNSYLPSLYSYIINTDAKALCSSAGVCPKVCDSKDAAKFNDELTCEFCEHVLQHIKDLATTNTTVEEFRTALLNFCKHVGSFSGKCTALVNDYYDMLFDYIRNLNTKGMCTLIGLCNNEKCGQTPLIKLIPALETKKRIPLIKLQPASHIQNDLSVYPLVRLVPASVASKKEMIETNEIFLPEQLPLEKYVHPLSIFEKDTECSFCRAISFYIKQDLKEDKSKEGVRNALDNVCEKWVVDFPDHCKSFLQKHSMKIQHAVANGVELEDVCTFSKVCEVDENHPEVNVRVLPKEKAGPFCDLCKDAMTEVENALSDPATKQKIVGLLDQYCNRLPKSIRDECSNFLNSSVDALIDILQQELQPDNICPALHLCDASKRIQVSGRVKDLECDVCKDVVTSFRQKLSDPNAKKIVLTFLEEGCARLPGSLSQECRTFVDENIDTLIGMIIEELDPDTVCSILKICPASLRREKPKRFNDIECDLCKEVVRKLQDLIKDQKTEEEIKAALDKVCSYLPSSMAAKCATFVNQYTDLLITLLMQEMDPEMICAALNVCPTSLRRENPKRFNDIECDLCKEVVGKVKDLIKDQKTEEEIKAALDKVCSYLPSSMAAKCATFVNQYTDLLITLLMQEMDSEMICAALNVCPTKVGFPEWQSKASLRREKPKRFKDIECSLCKEVIRKLQDLIKDQKTEEEIKAALDKVCSYLPSSMAAKCTTFVNQYTDLLITLLMSEMDPDMICAFLNVCPTKVGFPEWQSKAQDLECQGCQYALHYVQEQLYNAETQDEVKNLMKKICDVLPNTFAKNCDAFVEEYGSALLVLLAQELDPSKMCYELQMCTNQSKLFEKQTNILHPFKNDECSVCTTVVDYIDKLLEEDDVDKEITKLAEKVCTILPASYVAKCNTILETYGPYILQMIGQLSNSTEVCQEIDLCSTPPGHVHLVGGNKCTFGPSYWCKSSAHASACKAEMFCKERVWNQ